MISCPGLNRRSASGVDAGGGAALRDSGGDGHPAQRTGKTRERQDGERNSKNERKHHLPPVPTMTP